jgi:hypothetical protein
MATNVTTLALLVPAAKEIATADVTIAGRVALVLVVASPRWRPPLRPSFQAAEEELVDLDLVLERLALWGDHRPAQLRKISHAVS